MDKTEDNNFTSSEMRELSEMIFLDSKRYDSSGGGYDEMY